MASRNISLLYQDSVVFHPWDDPLNILSIETSRKLADFILVFLPCIVVIGLSTNSVSGLVFWRQGLGDRMNLCLFCLTLADFGYLVAIVFTQSVSFFMSLIDSRVAAEYTVKLQVNGLGFMFGCAAVSRLISMVIAVERCACVVLPLRAASLIRTRTMGIILAAIFVLVLGSCSTSPAYVYVTSVQNNVTGNVRWIVLPTTFATNNYQLTQAIKYILNTIPRVVIPVAAFIISAIATFITVVRLRAAMAWRQQTSSRTSDAQGQQMALTKMLVVLSCVDITCSTPVVIQGLLESCRPDFITSGPFYNLVRTTGTLSTVFFSINSSVNFFVYFGRSTRFRHELQTLCCRCLCVNQTEGADRCLCVNQTKGADRCPCVRLKALRDQASKKPGPESGCVETEISA